MKKIALLLSLITYCLPSTYAGEENLIEENTNVPVCATALPKEVCGLDSSFWYRTVGIGPIPIPALNLGIGRRIKRERYAGDFTMNLATLGLVNALQVYANGLCYVHQKPSAHTYIGAGASAAVAFSFPELSYTGYIAPNILGGREFIDRDGNRRFFQVEVLILPFGIYSSTLILPVVTLKYGIDF
ncbi:MAG: hypothetical protein KR126chlam1_01326 [Chlamydiae bacterium]|nr:hypothetical protein [Chlamydiota bacterium]